MALVTDKHSTLHSWIMQWTVCTSLSHTVCVQSLRRVVMPLAKCWVLTTLPWVVVTTHCHGLTRRVWRCCSDRVEQVNPPELLHVGLIGVWNYLICSSLVNSKCITPRLGLSSVIELWWHMLTAQVHAHGMLLCVCWWYENMSELLHCSRPTRPQEHCPCWVLTLVPCRTPSAPSSPGGACYHAYDTPAPVHPRDSAD